MSYAPASVLECNMDRAPALSSQLSAPGLTVSVTVSVCNIDHTPAGDYRASARICTGPGRATLRGRRLVKCDHGTKINGNTKQTDRVKKVISIIKISKFN